ncbi:hypothetical protein ElyMa_002690800 [Elysia marginata]|uniref:Uncharacterized protein n=1 Tax=Elysia marginata TaxID=1093978 RepID=A0AAV4HAM5_9GAST|nr:hypothetical protein ElyMa_002690800 [Elysia marginata]
MYIDILGTFTLYKESTEFNFYLSPSSLALQSDPASNAERESWYLRTPWFRYHPQRLSPREVTPASLHWRRYNTGSLTVNSYEVRLNSWLLGVAPGGGIGLRSLLGSRYPPQSEQSSGNKVLPAPTCLLHWVRGSYTKSKVCCKIKHQAKTQAKQNCQRERVRTTAPDQIALITLELAS